MRIKRFVSAVMAVIMVASISFPVAADENAVALRAFFEGAGAVVEWHDAEGRITVTLGENAEVFQVGAGDTAVWLDNGTSFISAADAERALLALKSGLAERTTLWREDVEAFRDAVMHVHPRFWDRSEVFVPADALGAPSANALWFELDFNVASRQNFTNAIDSLLSNIENLTDTEILIAMQAAAAQLNDNHFRFLPPWGEDEVFPLGFSHFGGMTGGFYLTHAAPAFMAALNHRLVAINGVVIGAVSDMFAEIYPAENLFDIWRFLPQHITALPILEYLGLWDDGAVFTFENDSGDVVELALSESDLGFAGGFIDLREEGDVPMYLDLRDHNRFTFIEEHGILYIRIETFSPNVIIALMAGEAHPAGVAALHNAAILTPLTEVPADMTDPMEQVMLLFGIYEGGDRQNWAPVPEIIELFEAGLVEAVIVDVRGNPGGDQLPFLPLLRYIAENTPEGRFFYFVNHESGSASFLTTMIAAYMDFTIAGTPPAQNTLFHGLNHVDQERSPVFMLPNAGLMITIPNRFVPLDEDISGLASVGISAEAFLERFPNLEFYAFRPNVEIPHTIKDWIENRDPALAFVIELIGQE